MVLTPSDQSHEDLLTPMREFGSFTFSHSHAKSSIWTHVGLKANL